jgi:hypothetical protein
MPAAPPQRAPGGRSRRRLEKNREKRPHLGINALPGVQDSIAAGRRQALGAAAERRPYVKLAALMLKNTGVMLAYVAVALILIAVVGAILI